MDSGNFWHAVGFPEVVEDSVPVIDESEVNQLGAQAVATAEVEQNLGPDIGSPSPPSSPPRTVQLMYNQSGPTMNANATAADGVPNDYIESDRDFFYELLGVRVRVVDGDGVSRDQERAGPSMPDLSGSRSSNSELDFQIDPSSYDTDNSNQSEYQFQYNLNGEDGPGTERMTLHYDITETAGTTQGQVHQRSARKYQGNLLDTTGDTLTYWSATLINLLISNRVKSVATHYRPLSSQPDIWSGVSADLANEGFHVSPAKCYEKWKSLWTKLKTYLKDSKHQIDHPWNHFETLQDFHVESERLIAEQETESLFKRVERETEKRATAKRRIELAEAKQLKERAELQEELDRLGEVANNPALGSPFARVKPRVPPTAWELEQRRNAQFRIMMEGLERRRKEQALALAKVQKQKEQELRREERLRVMEEKAAIRQIQLATGVGDYASMSPPQPFRVALPVSLVSPTEFQVTGPPIPILLAGVPISKIKLPPLARPTRAKDISAADTRSPAVRAAAAIVAHDHTYASTKFDLFEMWDCESE